MPATSDIIQYFRGQLFQMPVLPKVDLSGKTVVITGANTGLGFECAKQLYAPLPESEIIFHLFVNSGTTTVQVSMPPPSS